MPKLLHRHAFTHRGIYTKVLHTDAADASAHRSFWTQMPLHTEAFTERRFDIHTPIHTEAFRHRLFSRESQKLWHREAFSQRIFYTQKLLHTSFSTEAFTQRSFYAQELLHTDAFTHRSLYTRRLLRTEAFTQRSLYTQTLSHRKTDFTEQLLHTSKNRNFTYVFDVRPSYRAKGLRPALENRNFWHWTIILREWVVPDLVKSQFYTSFLSRETVVPDLSKWIKSQFTPILERLHLTLKNRSFPTVIAVWLSCHAYIWTFKTTILHQFLTVALHFVRRGCAGPHQICILPHVWMSDLRDVDTGLPVPKRNSHSTTMFGRSKRTISADGCCGQRSFAFHHAACLPIRHARSPQRVAQGQTRPAFRHTFGCPTRRRG